MRPKHIIILGGGACGLAAGWELVDSGHKVTLVERAQIVGGLAGYIEKGGNRYEYGSHVFHTDQEELRERILSLMGNKLFSFERGSKLEIKFRDKYYPFPLNGIEVVKNLPVGLSALCVLSLIKEILINAVTFRKPESTEEYLKWHFGEKLYEIFFRDYTKKFWGVPCSDLDAKFGQERIPRSDVFRILHDLIEFLGLQKFINKHPLVERSIGKLYYTSQGLQGMYQSIADYINQEGGQVCESFEAIKICVQNNRSVSVKMISKGKEETVHGDYLLSTIPINSFIRILDPLPPKDVLDSVSQLRYLPLKVCGLLVDRENIRDKIMTYYQDKIFNRLSEPTNHGLLTTPHGKTVLLAEMTPFSIKKAGLNTEEEIFESVATDLSQEGLLKKNEILDWIVYGYECAYPIYLKGFNNHLNKFHSYIHSINNIYSAGRQGQFVYVNLHKTMMLGIEAAREIDKL